MQKVFKGRLDGDLSNPKGLVAQGQGHCWITYVSVSEISVISLH